MDVNLLLSTLKSTDTQVGEWVNVIGYIAELAALDSRTERKARVEVLRRETVCVQAVMLWSAGAIKLGEYERVLQERKEVGKRLRIRS